MRCNIIAIPISYRLHNRVLKYLFSRDSTNMNKKIIAAGLAATLISSFGMAQDAPSYTFAEISYLDFNGAAGGFDADGLKLDGSFALGTHFFVTANYSSLSGNFDLDISGLGLGFKNDFDNGGSLFGSYTLNNWDFGFGDIDIDTLRVGYRHMASEKLELNASFTSNDFEGGSSETGYQFGGVFSATDSVQITANYETIDELDMFSIGARFNF